MFGHSEEELKESDSGGLSEIQEEQKEYYDSPERVQLLTEEASPSRRLQFSVNHNKVHSGKTEWEEDDEEDLSCNN